MQNMPAPGNVPENNEEQQLFNKQVKLARRVVEAQENYNTSPINEGHTQLRSYDRNDSESRAHQSIKTELWDLKKEFRKMVQDKKDFVDKLKKIGELELAAKIAADQNL